MRGLFTALGVLGALGSALGLFFGWLQELSPAMDSFSHFRIHFAVILALSAVLLLVVGTGMTRWVALLPALFACGWVWLFASEGPPSDGPRGDLRLVQFNLNYRNPVINQVMDALTRMDADVLTLQEVQPAHEAALRGMAAYPHQTHCFFRDGIGGVSVLSKHPLSGIDCAVGQGLVLAVVDAPGGAVTVASIHTYWPWPFSQHAQVDGWLPRLEQTSGPVIVAGDFNAAPWSDAVSKVANASRTTVVPGLRMTIEVMGVPIPIDHALISKDFCATSAQVGPEIGSDHFPVIFDLERTNPSLSTGCAGG